MMKSFIIILCMLISNLAFAQIGKESDTLEIWTFSLGNYINQNAERIIEKKYPFSIRGIAGDVIIEELIDSVRVHNNKIWNYLDSIGYTDSKKNFEVDLLSEIMRIKEAVKISQSNQVVFKLYNELNKRNLQNYTELKKVNDENYEFIIYSFDLKNINQEQVFELKFTSNLKNREAKIGD